MVWVYEEDGYVWLGSGVGDIVNDLCCKQCDQMLE